MKKLLFAIILGTAVVSCSGSGDDDEIVQSITLPDSYKGDLKLVRYVINGTTTVNTDNTLYVKLDNSNIQYKLPNNQTFVGTYNSIVKASNGYSFKVSNGVEVVLFNTIYEDGSKRYIFKHEDGSQIETFLKQ